MKAFLFQDYRITSGAIIVFGLLVVGFGWGQEPAKPAPSKPQQVKPIQGGPPLNSEVHVLVLKHSKSDGVAKALRELFPEKDGLTLRIASEPDMNALLLRGSPEEVDKIYAVIDKLEKIAHETKMKKEEAR